jgi:hypothetical protein
MRSVVWTERVEMTGASKATSLVASFTSWETSSPT